MQAPYRSARHVAREDIAVRIAGSCILTKHPSGSRTNSSPSKLGRAAKRSPLRKEVAKEKDHTKVGSFRLARAAGARCIRRRIVGRFIRSCRRRPRPRGGSVSDTTEKVAGNAVNPRRLTRLLGIWAPHRQLFAPLCGYASGSANQWGGGGNFAVALTWARREASEGRHRSGDIYSSQRDLGTKRGTIA